MKIKTLIHAIVLSMVTHLGYAQKKKISIANKQYESYAYIDAITTYESVMDYYKDEEMFQRLGNAYYFNAKFDKASKWYKELFLMNENQSSEYLYRYSQTLKSIGDYAKSDELLEQFNKKSENELRAKLYNKNRNYLEEIRANSGRFNVRTTELNSEFSDYGTSFFGNKLVFTSNRNTDRNPKEVFKWTNQPFSDIYISDIKSDSTLMEPKLFERKVNSKFNESTPVFTKDGLTMYFTRSNFLKGKRRRDRQGITLLKIFKATFKDGKWKNITELPFNSDQYSIAHPALSIDEKTLYFASDMPGTIGQSDLFKVSINEDGSYSNPENLGEKINTEGRETFPFVSTDNELYYASDGRPGLGGLDIYVTNIIQNKNSYEVLNIGSPVNGANDDFAFVIDKNRKGFFSSNREGGKGYDDIYRFIETKRIMFEQILKGIVIDKKTRGSLVGTKISLYDEKFNLLKESTTDDKAEYDFIVEIGKTYHIRAEHRDYETKEYKVSLQQINGDTYFPIELEKRIIPIEVGTDLVKVLDIPMIYFDLDKSYIRKDTAIELAKVLAVLQQYPKMKIEIRSHTDSRQTSLYNFKLSNRRAKATMEWLIKNGIESRRLIGKGFGETQLVNHCYDGMKCSEKEHQANRRSEFIIISMK